MKISNSVAHTGPLYSLLDLQRCSKRGCILYNDVSKRAILSVYSTILLSNFNISQIHPTGWGWKHYPGIAYPTLQQGMLRTVSKWECSRRLRNSPVSDQLSISDQMLCAGFNSNNPNAPDTSACRGDSGGPFVCKDYHDQWVLQGVVSWGSVR